MASKCASLVLALVCLQVSASVNDANCLVQSRKDVQLQHHTALNPSFSGLPKGLHLELPSALRELTKQFPSTMGTMPMSMPNMSMEDMMAVGMEVLGLFRNKTLEDLMFEGLRNMSTGLLAYSEHLYKDSTNLSVVAANTTNKAEVLAAVGDYLVKQSQALAQMAADVAVDARHFMRLLPPGKLRNMSEPMLQMTGSLTKEQVSSTVHDLVMLPLIKSLISDEATFCAKFQPMGANLTAASSFLTKQAPGQLEQLKGMLPQASGMIEGFAPDVAPKVAKFLNATMATLTNVTTAFQLSVPKAASVLADVAETRLGCDSVSDLSDRSIAASLRAKRLGFVAAVGAAMWVLAA